MVEDNETKTKKEPEKEEVIKEIPKTSDPIPSGSPQPLEEAKAINEKKAELLDREEKLMERKEKLEAEKMVGGGSPAGGIPQEPSKPTDEEIADKFNNGELDILSKNG